MDDDEFSWLNPPSTVHDPGAWDRYWNDQISHGLNPELFDMFIGDEELIRVMSQQGMRTVLCAGNGISREPAILAAAGFDVTALDSSPVALKLAELIAGEAVPAGRPTYVVGDLLHAEICAGPFDAIIERRTLQLFPESERGAALDALLARLHPEGLFLSHCHDGRWRPPAKPRHFTKPLLLQRGLTLWSGPDPKPAGRVAWIQTSTG